MSIGDRVVRGPDWQIEDHDGGEGGVGTIVSVDSFDDGSSLPDNHVLVYWDIGFLSCYRAGFDGYHDLRILDSAPAGVIFHSVTCDGCNQPRIAGTRWHCAACHDYDLCTTCYTNDEHDTSHNFKVFPNNISQGMIVEKRSKAAKIRAKGIFPGAKVKTGRDWELERLNHGTVLEISPMDKLQRSAVLVKWANFCDMLHRVGYKGKVDLEVMQFSEGPYYYKTHLPLVSLNDTIPLSGSKPEVPNSGIDIAALQHMMGDPQTFESVIQKRLRPNKAREDINTSQSTPEKSASQTLDKTCDLKPPQEPSVSVQSKTLQENTKEILSKTAMESTSKRPPPVLPKPRQRQPKPQEIPAKIVSTGDTKLEHEAEQKESVHDIITKINTLPRKSSKTRRAPPPPRSPFSIQPTGDSSAECNALPQNPSIKTRPAPPRPQSVPSMNALVGVKNVAKQLEGLGLTLTGPSKRNMERVTSQTSYQEICAICDVLSPDVIFEPCLHIIACQACAWKMRRCLTCKTQIERKVTQDGETLKEPMVLANAVSMVRLNELEKELDEVKRDVECQICMEQRCNTLFNCGHKTCSECSENMRQCPYCKVNITERKIMY